MKRRKIRMDRSRRQMQEMEHDKSADDGSAQHHRPRRPTGTYVRSLHVSDRSRLLFDHAELNGRPDMQDDRNEKNRPQRPKQRKVGVERFGVMVHYCGTEKNLKIAKHVGN